jgi:hypothetical protein
MFGFPEDGKDPRIPTHIGLPIGGSTGMAAGCWSKGIGAKVPVRLTFARERAMFRRPPGSTWAFPDERVPRSWDLALSFAH